MSENNKYIVSARKYRPATFSTVVGQKNLTSTLKNAISSGRLANAYLFCGPRGVGKTSCARIFAKTINCLNPTADGEACGECDSCRAIDAGNSYNLIELDAASNNGVDDIRAITEQVNIPPQMGRYRVFIIDEVHMLTTQAFNAFLKTLEEPPSYAIFILATTEKHKVIPTILSRCQIYDFKRITIDDIVEHLEYVAGNEGITADRRALGVIARKADGAMRDALSIFDQVAASCRGQVSYEATIDNLNVLDYEYFFRLVEAFGKGDVAGALLIYKEIRDKGFDTLFFINGLMQHIRDLMVAADPRTVPLLEMAADTSERFKAQASSMPLPWYYASMKILNDCDFNYRTATNKQLLAEVTLIRLCQLLKPSEPPFNADYRNPPLGNPATGPIVTASQPVAPQTPHMTSEPAAALQQPVPAQARPAAPSRPQKPADGQAVQPVQPHVAPQPRPTTGARTMARPHSIRITDTSDSAARDTRRLRDTPVSLDRFMQAWNVFINRHPEMHILTSAMRSATPQQVSPIEFNIFVGHPAQVQAFESTTALTAFLRDELANDNLSIRAMIDPNQQIERPLAPREFLEKVITENPTLGEFLKNMDAELA